MARTDVDWSKHEYHETFRDDQAGVRILDFKKPDTRMMAIRFIYYPGGMSIVGDYGNWIFCRPFFPSAEEGQVSDGYWAEKLTIHSCQNVYDFDPEATEEAINEVLNDDDPDWPLTEEEREYLEECLGKVYDGETWYAAFAHGEGVGRYDDHERVIMVKSYKNHLLCVFDAFEEICRRMASGQIQ